MLPLQVNDSAFKSRKSIYPRQRNKSEIINLFKEILRHDNWGDEGYKKKLQELVAKDEQLVIEVIRKIKLEKDN